MSKQILIDSYFGLVRTAIAEGASLLDYYEESPDQGRAKGNIYRGVVKKVDAPIQAAFVRFGGGRDGFLPLRDVGTGSAPKIGDTVLVQVVKDEVGDKGAALTTKLALSGRYLVFIPERDSEGGISARITDEERAALKKILAELQIPDGGSVILRTAAMNKGIGELQKDLDRLTESYREITDKFSKGKEPGLLFREVPPALRYLREYYAPDVERIWVNQEDVLDQCRQFFYLYEPKSAAKVSLSQDGPLMFQKLGLEADVERLNSRKVSLPSGANIVFDQAEALVAIDVNSAKAGGRGEDGRKRGEGKGGNSEKSRQQRGNGLEETVFAVNKEAAGEIARQLRLRDLGGIIIVDFIDMEEEKHRRQIEEVMRRALAGDKAKVKVYDISPLGIMQISRQRLRKAGPNFSRQACEPCQGRGWHPSPAAGALATLRKMEERLHGKKAGQSLMVSVPYPVANKLMNEFREHVFSMEKRFGCSLRVTALPSVAGEASIAAHGPGGEEARSRDQPAPAERGRGERRREDGRRDEGRGENRVEGRGDGRRDGRGRRTLAQHPLTSPVADVAQDFPQELIRGHNEIPSHEPEAPVADFEPSDHGEPIPDTPPRAPVQGEPASPLSARSGTAAARSRGKSQPSRARAPLTGVRQASEPHASEEGKRGTSRHRRAKPVTGPKGSDASRRQAGSKGVVETNGPAGGVKKGDSAIAIKAPLLPAKPAVPARQPAKDSSGQGSEVPRHRSRRRSRRGKSGSKEGAPSASNGG
ncbi:MAG: ribonuclease E/G [Fibrobacteria bacterium]